MKWSVVKGPFWKKENDVYDPEKLGDKISDESPDPVIPPAKQSLYDKYKNKKEMENWKPVDGDYIYTPDLKGIYIRGGIMQGGSETDDDDIYDEWKNLLYRESLAYSSLLKINHVKASTFMTKGRLHQIGLFLQENPVDVVYINTTLSFVQKRNLEIYFNNYINERNDRIRAYNIKSAMKVDGDATDTESNFSNIEEQSNNKTNEKRVRVLDRFNVIISIFSQRAKSKISQLQIELAYLKYVKTRLARGGHSGTGAVYKEFGGDFLNLYQEIQFEVVSGKQSTSRGSVGGSGETQLEIERRRISHREIQIRELLENLKLKRAVERESRREKARILPTLALVGYTNAGKTALMNLLANTSLESENKLFQTLNTTIKRIKLPNLQNALLLDTVGFISNLPHELVESFKSTLEEIFFADILIHVIDVSNPAHSFQRKSVYSVLNEIFPKNNNYKHRMIEIWNKIDLLDDINTVDGFMSDNEYPVIPISVKNKINLDMFYSELTVKINNYLGKEQRELRCQPENYDKLVKWVKEAIGNPSEITYDDSTQEMVLKIMMDNSEYERYLENFVIMRENKRRKGNKDE